MQQEDILSYKTNVFSQNGEDGIIRYIFDKIGTTSKLCCEFGAWDGIHFSNCRNLILQGWGAVMIEGDDNRFTMLAREYQSNHLVRAVHCFVNTANNTLDRILSELNIAALDLLSIDIDGLDYQIFESSSILPRVICIEVNAGHNPQNRSALPENSAKNNVGQPLALFCDVAKTKGYSLVCYNANAFFVRKNLCQQYSLPSLSSEVAYANFLHHLSTSEREWLYLVNKGTVPPYHQFHNPRLHPSGLGIDWKRAIMLQVSAMAKRYLKKVRSAGHDVE